jgi:ribosomal-protein-alanine acetyltransferase
MHAIRTARPADLDAIAAIEAASFSADRFSRHNLRRMLASRSAAFLLAEADGAALGYALILFRDRAGAARLYSIAIAPEARGLGLAKALIEAVEACAISRGADRLRLEVRASNKAAIGLYATSGFSILKESPGYYDDGETAVKMEKRLSAEEARA